VNGTSGTANTGGGGGGVNDNATGGNGGSGVVIITYTTTDGAAYTITGGTITTNGAKTVHTFNSSGTFSVTQFTDTPEAYLVPRINPMLLYPKDMGVVVLK
jgi:hypothetical protein